jgi:hypothetical protein
LPASASYEEIAHLLKAITTLLIAFETLTKICSKTNSHGAARI